jgi:hypothetical protein
MAAPTSSASPFKKSLANREPSTHGFGQCAYMITNAFINIAWNLWLRCVGAAAFLQGTLSGHYGSFAFEREAHGMMKPNDFAGTKLGCDVRISLRISSVE